jgi:hypothetical protein
MAFAARSITDLTSWVVEGTARKDNECADPVVAIHRTATRKTMTHD